MWQTEVLQDHWWSNKGFQGIKLHETIIGRLVFIFHKASTIVNYAGVAEMCKETSSDLSDSII